MSTGGILSVCFAVQVLLALGWWGIPWVRDNLRSHTPEWRQARLREWIMSDLPPVPPEVDYDYIARRITQGDDPRTVWHTAEWKATQVQGYPSAAAWRADRENRRQYGLTTPAEREIMAEQEAAIRGGTQ